MIKEVWLGSILTLAIACMLISVIFFSQSRKNKDIQKLRKYTFGIGISIFFLGFSGLLDFSAIYAMEVLGHPNLFPDAFQFITIGQDYFYVMISILLISFSVLSYEIETHIKNVKRHMLTAILLVCFFVSSMPYFGGFIPSEYHVYLMYMAYGCLLPFAAVIVYWGLFYLRTAISSAGMVRKKALLVMFGLGGLFLGIILDVMLRSATPLHYDLLFVCKAMSITGVILISIGFKH